MQVLSNNGKFAPSVQTIRNHIAFRILWLLLAVHIFNCSVDMPDPQPDYVPEDLSINDMESVVEIVLEKVINFKDAIAEHDEDDEDSNTVTLNEDIDLFMPNSIPFLTDILPSTDRISFVVNDENFKNQFHPELVPPPPRHNFA